MSGEPILLARKLVDGFHIINDILHTQLRNHYNLTEQLERQEKIAAGLKIAYERMLEFKRHKNSEVVVIREGMILRFKP